MFRSFVSAVIIAAPAIALGATWEIDTAHSQAGFEVRHMMVADVEGDFGKVAGTVTLDEKDPSKSSIEATIDAASIDTGDDKRDGHLKSADFFDVAKHPTLTFKSTKVEKGASKDKYKVTGNLTMRGVTKPVTLDVTWPGNEIKDPWGNVKTGATATTTINRKDWGLTWNKALEAGGVMVSDEVKIDIKLELAKKTPAKS